MRFYYILLFSIFFSNLVSAQNPSSYREFYSNGKLKSIKHEGFFDGCHMPIGVDTFFYKSGEVFMTVVYDNRRSKTEAGCHEGWTVELTKTYFKNGILKNKSQVKHGYEGEPCNCGTWIWYTAKRQIVKTQKNSPCYNQKSCD